MFDIHLVVFEKQSRKNVYIIQSECAGVLTQGPRSRGGGGAGGHVPPNIFKIIKN